MKKVLLALLVLLGLQTQAQITLCDSNYTYTAGSQYQLEIAFPVTGNSLPFMAPIYAVTYGGQDMLGEDSCFNSLFACNHVVYNYNMSTGMPYDTITTCVSYTVTDTMGYVDTMSCCFNQVWDGQAWMRMSNMGIPTAISELEVTRLNDNKIYDMLGKELTEIPVGQMYIRNQKLYINKKW